MKVRQTFAAGFSHVGAPAFLIILLLQLAIVPPVAAAQDVLASLLDGLSKSSFELSAVLYKLEGQRPDPRILPALKAAFEKATGKEEKQKIAATLLRLGEKTNAYFDYLAGYADAAIEDRTPTPLLYDSQGQFVRGQFNPGFENRCAQNNKDPRQVAKLLLYDFPRDVQVLAAAQDSRATELLRRGLQSTNTSVIMYSVQGLGRLHDSTAIPLIQKACDRIPAAEKLAVAMQVPWFGIEAEGLLEDLAPEPNLRNALKRMVYFQQLMELNAQRRRAGLEAIPIPTSDK